MMKIQFIVLVVVAFISCTKEKRYQRKIVNKWEINSSHEVWHHGSYLDEYDSKLNYSGHITFDENNLGISSPNENNPFPENFSWTNTKSVITIENLNSNYVKQYYIDKFTKTYMYIHFEFPKNSDPYTHHRLREHIVLKKLD